MATTHKAKAKRYLYKWMDSPVGRLKLVATDDGLAAILWERDRPRRVPLEIDGAGDRHAVIIETERQLEEYFTCRRTRFTMPLDPRGTAFQRKVWNALLTIPFGETRSYGQIARQIGHPDAVRAVGAANGRNPISIITPCHRVIGATGKLTGFAGGLDAKAFLLALEGSEPRSGAGGNAVSRIRNPGASYLTAPRVQVSSHEASTGSLSRLRHRYHDATDRYGRHDSPIFLSRSGFGRVRSL